AEVLEGHVPLLRRPDLGGWDGNGLGGKSEQQREHPYPFNLASSASSSGSWLGSIIARACASDIHCASTTSGKRSKRPLRGGHSSSNSLERIAAGSRSPSTAKTS